MIKIWVKHRQTNRWITLTQLQRFDANTDRFDTSAAEKLLVSRRKTRLKDISEDNDQHLLNHFPNDDCDNDDYDGDGDDDDDDDDGVYLKAVNTNLRANLQMIKSVNLKYL